MAFKHGNHTLIDLDAGNDTKITSAAGQDIVFYPDQHIWIKQGTKLIFEGTVPDDFEAKLQATAVTADRDLILPDESGTLATQAYVTSAVTGGALANTDALAEGSTNLYYTDARADTRATLRITAADIGNLNNVSGTAPSNGDFLLYDAGASEFAPVAFATEVNTYADARIGVASIQDLSDVDGVDTPANGDTLVYDGTDFGFVNFNSETNSLFDIRFATKSTTDLTGFEGELTGDLITGQNRIAFADTGTVSFLDFTVDLFSENNHTVLSSVKSIDFFLDSNGGDSGQAFRIFNNQNPDGTVTETSHIFKVAETGDVSVSNDLSVAGNATITGDLTVSGTTTTINTNELNIGDNIITLNSDETGTPSQNAGIEVERGTSTNVAIRWNEATDQWEFSNDGTTYVAFGTSTTFTGTTDGINEGTTNLYYTDARVRTEVEGSNLDMGSNNITTTGKILFSNVYTNVVDLPSAATYHGMFAHVHGTGKGYYAHGGNWIRLANYDELTFVTGSGLDLSQKSTTDLPEGTNLYFTNARAISALTSADVQTDSLGVGTAASGTTGEIRATHDVTAYYSSDANLKTNVVSIENALDKVKQIRGVEFDWTQEYIDDKGGEDGYFVRKHDVGVIAQEVEAVLPEVVGTRENGTKAVRYDRMVALLVEAIKDQQSQIDELKQIITDLGNK